jgi:hypothetical protein
VSARAAWFVAAVAVSSLAAWWRWPDSAHAMGIIRKGGGTARHAVEFPAGPGERILVATARVIPPYRGDARLVLEGEPPLPWRAEVSRPVVDLGLHRWPRLEGDVLRGLEPGQRLALWVALGPIPETDPVCGMRCEEGALRDGGRCFCSEPCLAAWRRGGAAGERGAGGGYRLALRDVASGQPVLTIPVRFGAEGGGHAGAHH